MKIVILIGDGMADYPLQELDNKTILEAAAIPNMDRLAGEGVTGLVQTVPEGMDPGSDTANLSIFGYDPEVYYTGRAPLEALNMGIELGPKDVAFRCNIVNIIDDIMEDFSAGHIETPFTEIVIKEIADNIKIDGIEFYPGVSYRNIVIWRNYPGEQITESIPPHDIHGKNVREYLPSGECADTLKTIMDRSKEIIENSPRIRDAAKRYSGNPESLWLWGGGRKPLLDPLSERFGLKGYTISAVDLIHGIGRAAGLKPWPVEGATGYIDTNYEGKAAALFEGLKKKDYIYLHVEAPDESGHQGNIAHKLKAVEDFDAKIVGPVMEGMKSFDDYALLIMPDHPTPISTRTHSSDPVPFIMYRSGGLTGKTFHGKGGEQYSEGGAKKTGLFVPRGHDLLEIMITGAYREEK